MSARRFGLVASVVALSALACQILAGVEDRGFTVDAAAPVTDPCDHAYPPPPSMDAAKGEDLPPIYFAFHQLEIPGVRDGGRPVGYDLDDRCTCNRLPEDAGPTALDGGPSCVPPAGVRSVCDGDGGIDNAASSAFAELAVPAALFDVDIQRTINIDPDCGRRILLFAVNDYNGQRDDDAITVWPVVSWGIHTPHDGGEPEDGGLCGPMSDSGPFPSRYDGTDVWSLPSWAYGTGMLNRTLLKGYVRDFTIVINWRSGRGHEDDYTLPLSLGMYSVSVAKLVFTATLVPIDEEGDVPVAGDRIQWRRSGRSFRFTNGILAGRAAASELLRAISEARISHWGKPQDVFCNNPLMYEAIRASACNNLDVVGNPARDNMGDPCDGLSVQVQVEGAPVMVGRVGEAQVFPKACGPEVITDCDAETGR